MLSFATTSLAVLSMGALAYSPGPFFQSKTVIIPHDDKIKRGGEDAADSCDTALAVADGVGGWADVGVNPGLFSAALTKQVIKEHEENPDLSPVELVHDACEKASGEHLGSATLVVLTV